MRLSGKTALVTGAGVRLGRGIALALAQAGADVVVHYHASAAEAEETAAAVREAGRRAWLVRADLLQEGEATGLLAGVAEEAGPIDLLINSAAMFPADRVGDFGWQALEANLRLNAWAPLVLARALAEQGRGGCIVNVLDSRMVDYDREHASYHLSKRMLLSLTKMLALEFAPGVRVNAVAPGLILPPPGEGDDYLERMKQTNPLQEHGTVEQIGEAVVYLAGASFVTGQVLFVDGGRHLKGRVYE